MASPAAPLDPFGHLSSFITSLQKKANQDSSAITDLKQEVDKLKQAQQAQQVKLDALEAKADAFGKAGPPGGDEAGAGAGSSEGQVNVGRKRARSITDTLEQEEGVVSDEQSTEANSHAILTKLNQIEASILSEVRANGATMTGIGDYECDCGYVAAEVGEEVGRKIDDLESAIRKAIESKLKVFETTVGDRLSAVESNLVDAIEDNSGGCECDSAEYAKEEIEHKLGEVCTQVEAVVGELKKDLAGLDLGLVAKLTQIQQTQAELLAKVTSSAAGAPSNPARPVVVASKKPSSVHQAASDSISATDHLPHSYNTASPRVYPPVSSGRKLPPLPSSSASGPFVLGSVAHLAPDDPVFSPARSHASSSHNSAAEAAVKAEQHVHKKAKKRAIKAMHDFDDLATELFPLSDRGREDSHEV